MISITRFNGSTVYLNADLIQTVESTPDTVITLTNNVKIVIKEKPQEVINKIIAYQRLVHNPQLEIISGD
ncbi:MAG: flagellar FlbD family protein [Anaerolineaceae bacterium]